MIVFVGFSFFVVFSDFFGSSLAKSFTFIVINIIKMRFLCNLSIRCAYSGGWALSTHYICIRFTYLLGFCEPESWSRYKWTSPSRELWYASIFFLAFLKEVCISRCVHPVYSDISSTIMISSRKFRNNSSAIVNREGLSTFIYRLLFVFLLYACIKVHDKQ